jgi:hypothetical protein
LYDSILPHVREYVKNNLIGWRKFFSIVNKYRYGGRFIEKCPGRVEAIWGVGWVEEGSRSGIGQGKIDRVVGKY